MFTPHCIRIQLVASSLFLASLILMSSMMVVVAYPGQTIADGIPTTIQQVSQDSMLKSATRPDHGIVKRSEMGTLACDTLNRVAMRPGRDGRLYEIQASKWSEVEGVCLNAWTIRFICMLALDVDDPEAVADNVNVIRHCQLPMNECRQYPENVWLEVQDRVITRISAHCVNHDELDDYDLVPEEESGCSGKKRFPRPAGSMKGHAPPQLQLTNQATMKSTGKSVNVDKLYFQVSTPDRPDVWHSIGETFGQGLATTLYTFVAASVIVKFCVALSPHGHLHPAYHFLAAGFIHDVEESHTDGMLPNMTIQDTLPLL